LCIVCLLEGYRKVLSQAGLLALNARWKLSVPFYVGACSTQK
jgi:hypothetical protein